MLFMFGSQWHGPGTKREHGLEVIYAKHQLVSKLLFVVSIRVVVVISDSTSTLTTLFPNPGIEL